MDWDAVFIWVEGFGGALGTIVGLGVAGWKFITRAQRKAAAEMDRRVAEAEAGEKEADHEAAADRAAARTASAQMQALLMDQVFELRKQVEKQNRRH